MKDYQAFLILCAGAFAPWLLLTPVFAADEVDRGAQRLRADTIVGIIENKPRWHEDIKEDPEKRRQRLTSLATAIVERADAWTCKGQPEGCERRFRGSNAELIAFVITIGYWESRFSDRIHRGLCRGPECDFGWARTAFQIKPVKRGGVLPNDLWDDLFVNDSNAANGVMYVTESAWRACHATHGIEGVFGVYGRGSCSAKYQVDKRVASYRKNLNAYLAKSND